jgi:hypothetical protein
VTHSSSGPRICILSLASRSKNLSQLPALSMVMGGKIARVKELMWIVVTVTVLDSKTPTTRLGKRSKRVSMQHERTLVNQLVRLPGGKSWGTSANLIFHNSSLQSCSIFHGWWGIIIRIRDTITRQREEVLIWTVLSHLVVFGTGIPQLRHAHTRQRTVVYSAQSLARK